MMGLCDGAWGTDSIIECWDYNHYGQLGIGTTASKSQPVSVNGMDSARAASLRDDSEWCKTHDAAVRLR